MKILLVRFSSLGDVVLTTAAVEALGAVLPDAEIDVLTKPGFREVFANNPKVNRLVSWQPEDGLRRLAGELRRAQYDWIVDLHQNLRTAVLRSLIRGPKWSTYRKGIWRRRLAVWLRRPSLLRDQPHVVERYLSALTTLQIAGFDPQKGVLPRVYPAHADRERVCALLREAGWDGSASCVALAPGARWATKAWPETHWRNLVVRLRQQLPACFVVLVGGNEEAELCRRILGSGEGANLAGKTGLLETAAVLQSCAVLVSNDSAPLHLSVAVGTPVVALFGPTHLGFGFAPLGTRDVLLERDEPCRPCSLHGDDRCPQGHHRCLVEIVPEHVYNVLCDRLPVGIAK